MRERESGGKTLARIIEIENHVSMCVCSMHRTNDRMSLEKKLKQNGTNDEAYIKHALNCIYAFLKFHHQQ